MAAPDLLGAPQDLEISAEVPVTPLGEGKALVLISFGTFGAMSIWFVASAILTPLKEEWQISDVQASFLTSVVNLGFCIGCFCSALLNLADVVPPPKLMAVGGSLAAAANSCLLLVHGLSGALLARFVVGLGLALVYPPSVKLISTWFAADRRSSAIGVMFAFFCLGSAFPQLLYSLAEEFSWRGVVAVSSVLGLLAVLMIYAMVEIGPFAFPSSNFNARKVLSIFQNRHVTLSILAYCGHQWELFCVWAWASEFFEHIWNMSHQSAHIWAFIIISLGGPGSWLGGKLGDRFGRSTAAMIMVTTSGFCTLVLGLLDDYWPFGVWISICVLWGLTALADSPNYSTLVTIHAEQSLGKHVAVYFLASSSKDLSKGLACPRSSVGTALTVQLFCGYLATILALYLVPRLSADWSWRWSLTSLSVGPCLSVLALMALNPKPQNEI